MDTVSLSPMFICLESIQGIRIHCGLLPAEAWGWWTPRGQGDVFPLSSQMQRHQGDEYKSRWRKDANDKKKIMNEVRCWESRNTSESGRVREKAFSTEFTQDARVLVVQYESSPGNAWGHAGSGTSQRFSGLEKGVG